MAEDSLTDPSKFPIPGLTVDDINPNVYEGGFKTWECAVDLATYLLHHSQLGSIFTNENMRVIEVGFLYRLRSACPECRLEPGFQSSHSNDEAS